LIKIKTMSDLNQLNIPEIGEEYRKLVSDYTKLLISSMLSLEDDENEYSLENDGYVVVITKDDDIDNLHGVGLNGSLCDPDAWPEWVERHDFSNGESFYQIAFMMDNDFIMIFYLDAKLLKNDPKAKEYLDSMCDIIDQDNEE